MTISLGPPDLTRPTPMADRVPSWQPKALIAFVVLAFGWTWGLWWGGAARAVDAPGILFVIAAVVMLKPGPKIRAY